MNCEQLCGFCSDISVMRDGRLLDSHPHRQNFISTPNQSRLLSYTPYVRHTCFPLFLSSFLGYFSWGALIIMELELGFQRRCREREMLSVSAYILCLLDSLHAMPFTWWIFVFKVWVKWEALDTLYIIGNQKILKSKSDVYLWVLSKESSWLISQAQDGQSNICKCSKCWAQHFFSSVKPLYMLGERLT